MLRFVFRKLLSNKGLNLSLITGIIFLVAVFTMLPAFSNGAVNQVLSREFSDSVELDNTYPTVVGRSGSSTTDVQTAMDFLAGHEEKWIEKTGLPVLEREHYLSLKGSKGRSIYGGRTKELEVAFIPELSDVTEIVDSGEPAYDSGNDAYPIYVSEYTMDFYSLIVGEEVFFERIKDENGNMLRLRVAGIIKEKEGTELYWYKPLNSFKSAALTDEDSFNEIVKRFGFDAIYCDTYLSFDYRAIRFDNADHVAEALDKIAEEDGHVTCYFKDILDNYKSEKKTINVIMFSATLPLMILLLMFIIMVASRITDNEKGEIAVLRSRGIKRTEMIILYFIRSIFLSLIAFVPGVYLGKFFVWMGSRTNGFLIFTTKDTSDYYLSSGCFVTAAVGAVFSVILITLPVIRLSKNTIIDNKNDTMRLSKKPLWKKFFLDVVLTAASVYLLHNYKGQTEAFSEKLINGENIDPLIMIGSAIFIFGIGLLLLRIIDLVVKLLFWAGKKHWGPASFASFLQIIRSGSRQGIISVFIVLTLSMGIFDASLARTVNDNNVKRIEYNVGTDVRMTGKWVKKARYFPDFTIEYYYAEPEYSQFQTLLDEGVLSNMTRVFYDEKAEVSVKNKVIPNTVMMGVNTAEFGRTATLMSGLNETHWYNALNAIAMKGNGVIISSNLATAMGITVGDKINCTRYDRTIEEGSGEIGTLTGEVSAIVDAWPGFQRYSYDVDENGRKVVKENFLIVMNYATAASTYKLTPYQVWGRFSANTDSESFKKNVKEKDVQVTKMLLREDEITDMKNSAMIQITNGLFSIHFFISIIICVLGFLIYWITSIKNRQLQFGIYRAMGLKMSEIIRMLVMEHFFSSFLAILAGVGAGILTSVLYNSVVAIVYLPAKHNIPLTLKIMDTDIVKPVFMILMALLAAFLIISRIIRKMRISETLKMGED